MENKIYNPVISVIVPVYNTRNYLERCLESIVNQSYKNLEIIIVNDGSTDDSGMLCDELAELDNRIKVLHKENGGLSSARNAGIDLSSGSFVTFVDSDDWLDYNIYNECVQAIKKYDCDVVDFKVAYSTDKTDTLEDNNLPYQVIKGETILYDYLYRGQTEKCPFSVCRKVYKRSLFKNIKFPNGRINEDIATNFKILEKSSNLVHLHSIGYFYNQDNINSITSGELKKKDFDLIIASKELVHLSKKYNDERIKHLSEIKLARSYFSLLAKAATGGLNSNVEKKDIDYLTKNLRKNYWKLIKSPIPLNRKIFITMASLDYKMISIPYSIYKNIKR